ncbi:class I SAM-dependent methyltransferase [Hyphomicrobium sp. D-2]|uniref:class I SAM-dependent methyltransferase n=1 Tax=Hyphomicrobium sp. D-2 TaxID=3041621 RepID=UPI00245878D0|nr:class I SAM-dependent methyltransferase [Hyphomicrobium sp. D-2]MDH4982762.1 class I SAM-dependent methyltransferase [Hyphomicrobium sp. D-2]
MIDEETMAETAQRGTSVPDEEALVIFQNQWDVYRKFLQHDYLSNGVACSVLQRFLTKDIARPFHFIDLACGDASGIAKVLRDAPVESYLGVDLSAPALALAADNLAAVNAPVTLTEADFSTVLQGLEQPADIVWISLSLHHLETDGKLEFMRGVKRALAPQGAFLAYEPTCRDGETRPAYLERFDEICRREWTALTAHEYAEAIHHVRTCDLQETATQWLELGREAGFASAAELYRSPDDLFRLFLYRH